MAGTTTTFGALQVALQGNVIAVPPDSGKDSRQKGGCHVILHVMTTAAAGRKNVQRYRDKMRSAGLRLIQRWVPDTRARGFAAECRRQSVAAGKNRRAENQVMRWIEANEDTEGWTP